MNERFRKSIDGILRRSPAQPLFQWRASKRLAALAYHAVDEPESFQAHVDFVSRHMHPVSLHDVIQATWGRRGLPRDAVLITFDDGHRSVFDAAMPILRDRGLPAVAFVVAGLLDGGRPHWAVEAASLAAAGGHTRRFPHLGPRELVSSLKRLPDRERLSALAELSSTSTGQPPWTPQLRRSELPLLEAAGIAVGNHSLTHACLSMCEREKLRAEIQRAHEIIASACGVEPRAFAYPEGDRDERVSRLLAEAGYEVAFLFDHRISEIPPADPLAMSRLRVDSSVSLDRFRIIVSGLHPALHGLLGRR